MSQAKMNSEAASNADTTEHHPVVIVGGGIGGLVLALCLDQVYNHNNNNSSKKTAKKLPIHVYESTTAYTANAGGAIGLYANGLRVLRNLNDSAPKLLAKVREAGCDYKYRRWMRHDGLEVAVAREDELLPDLDGDDVGDGDEDESGATTANNTSSTGGDSSCVVDADKRPRGGSFGLISKLTNRLSGISLSSSSSTTTTSSSSSSSSPRIETELQSLGIRRWKYQQVLYEACIEAGIEIHFGKRLQSATTTTTADSNTSKTLLQFKDGSKLTTSLLIGADGINSKVRNYILNPTTTTEAQKKSSSLEEFLPEYTGVTCLMGCANVPFRRGICFPSSATTKCHACYYPTRVPTEAEEEKEGNTDDGNNKNANNTNNNNSNDDDKYEMVFQIYFPSPIERPDTWRTLTPDEAKIECQELARKLREDGWEEQFLGPLESTSLKGVLRVGLRSREALDVWHVGGGSGGGEDVGRAVLLGDAAHPPVPYIGQGAQMAMEDAGTLSLLLGHFCPLNDSGGNHDDEAATIDLSKFQDAMKVYEKLRVPRTKAVLGSSVQLGRTQQKRADSMLYNAWRELSIKAQVWAYGTLPVMRPGAAFNYHTKVEEALKELETTTM